ncbi:class I SAM-dependent methyltransferase [Pseudoxanthomonas mexicana]|uniref:class I SAM-dependent methyltransferase n=1 Tax=Pseudoxanthomonas mexicana TaxID=128785 RepID=UPI0007844DA4|nr:class I SAM-dependent methyltransferase [Pseudoxanthomonas mexicana]
MSNGSRWIDVLISSLDKEEQSPLGEKLPPFPPEELQRNTTGLSSEATLRQAFAFYEDVVNAHSIAGRPLNEDSRVLDFGFGWGRISRVFMERVRVGNIHGVDVDPSFTALTNEFFGTGNFSTCGAFPPTKLNAGTFDLVFAYSVFSHLSGPACHAWMEEFHRILKPGGLVAFTTRHVSFMDFCLWAGKQDGASSYWRALGSLFPDFEEAKRRYAAGELVHASSEGVGGGGPRDSSFYGETWIPEQYARTAFAPGFEFVAGYFDGTKYDQSCFVLRKA